MKKIPIHRMVSCLLVCILLVSLCACGSKTKKNSTTPVTLNEVAHSIFYAPMYVAIENGYFKDEGIELTLVTGFGADKTMTALVSGEADIGFMGTESSIYAYIEGSEDYAVNFAQLTQRAGNFLVAREPMEDFKWSDLKDTNVLGGRAGGTPQMVFEYILKKNGIDPAADLMIDQSIDFGSTAAAFSGGQGDFTVEFEPSATALEKEGTGYVVASLGVDSGYVPYTAFCAKKSYLEKNSGIIQSFTDALQKGMDYVTEHTPEEIAKVIAPQFTDTDLDTITTIVTRYYDQEVPYENLVTTDYAEKSSTINNFMHHMTLAYPIGQGISPCPLYGAAFKSYSSREVLQMLKADGWYEVGCDGDPHQFKHPTKPGRVTLTHPRKDIPIGTLKNISRQSGVIFP